MLQESRWGTSTTNNSSACPRQSKHNKRRRSFSPTALLKRQFGRKQLTSFLNWSKAWYEVSQRKRKRVEQSFGWMKMVGTLRKVKLRGIDKVGGQFTFTGAGY